MNEDPVGNRPPFWALHTHVHALDWPSEATLTRLRSNYPKSDLVARPVRCDLFDGDPRAPLYAFKPKRSHRERRRIMDDPERAPYWTTQDRPLRPDQAVELALIEHELGFDWRLLNHQIEEGAVITHLASVGWPRDGP